MKRTVILIAMVSIIALSLIWNFTPPAGASKSGSKSESAKRNRREQWKGYDSAAENEATRQRYARVRTSGEEDSASSKPGALRRVGNFFKNLVVPSNSKAAKSGSASEGTFATDADMNSRSGVKMDRKEYLNLRGENIAMLRGLPLPEGFSIDVRAQAIRKMEAQEEQVRAAEKSGQLRAEGNGIWTPIGPAPIPLGQTTGISNPVSGRVLAIAVHPTNPNIVYVGTAQGGLYRTLDAGVTWTPLMDSAQSLAIGALAIDPNNPTTVFVGTGEGNLCQDCFFGVGLYRIRNADAVLPNVPTLEGPFNSAPNNNNTHLADARSITRILVNPNDSNQIFVTTSSGTGGIHGNVSTVLALSNRGIFRSDNAQAVTPTFTKLSLGGAVTTNQPIRDMEFEPGTPNNLLVAFTNLTNFSTSGVYRSTNALDPVPANVTFTRTLVSPAAEQAFNIQLAVAKVASVVTVYAALDELDPACASCNALLNYGTVKKSIDGGVTWTPAPLTGASGFCGGQGFYDMPIAVDPSSSLNVLIGGSGDYDADQTPNKRSVDGGGVWAKASTGLHPDTHDIVFAPSNPLIVYHGNDGGIFRSADGGATWTTLNNTDFNATQFVDLSTHPLDRYFMIGGTQDNGTPFLQPTNTWKLGDFGDGGYSIIDQNATDNVTVTAYHTYFNATDAQIGFSRAQTTAEMDPSPTGWPDFYGCNGTPNGIDCADAVLFYAPMAQGPGNPNTLYFGTTILYRSADKGPTMPPASQSFATRISAIGISPQSDNVRAVGTTGGLLFGTTTGANPLVTLDPSNQVPNQFITRLVFDPADNTAPYTAYAVLGNFLGSGNHVYKTTTLDNAGTTWAVASTGLPDVPMNAFTIDPLDSNRLYVGTDIGIYRSSDGGASWTPFSAGMPRVAVFDLEFQARSGPNPRVLRAATHGRGIWEIVLGPTAAPAAISGRITTGDGAPLGGVTMRLSGARSAKVISDSSGNYRFNNIDTDNFYTVTPSLVNYHFGPENQSFSLLANKTDAMFTATRDAVISGNAIDTADFFVRQHYLDFLGREPDESGFNFWSDQITSCGADAGCIERRTINVSAAYFLSIEFQKTGGLVDGLYRASYGRAPRYAEFMPDTAEVAQGVVVGPTDWAGRLAANKDAFVNAWVQRAEFRAAYDGLSNSAFVDTLIAHAGVGFNGGDEVRAALVSGLNNNTLTRAAALRQVVENEGFVAAKSNRMFVMMEYFGYLRRDPDESGYQFWLNKLNQFDGNFEQAEMVKAFIVSGEYRQRFGQ